MLGMSGWLDRVVVLTWVGHMPVPLVALERPVSGKRLLAVERDAPLASLCLPGPAGGCDPLAPGVAGWLGIRENSSAGLLPGGLTGVGAPENRGAGQLLVALRLLEVRENGGVGWLLVGSGPLGEPESFGWVPSGDSPEIQAQVAPSGDRDSTSLAELVGPSTLR